MKNFIPQIVISLEHGGRSERLQRHALGRVSTASFGVRRKRGGKGVGVRQHQAHRHDRLGRGLQRGGSRVRARPVVHGGQAIYGAASGMYVQIVAPEDISGGAKIGSVVALSHHGTEVIATLTGLPTLSEIYTFPE